MNLKKNVLIFFLFSLIAKEVASWTIDLTDVRKYLFEKNEREKKHPKNEYEDFIHNNKRFYSNIQGNSKFNSDYEHHGQEQYADSYRYQDYMEKKVHRIVHDGSVYLEGLRRSLEMYIRLLEDCNRGKVVTQNMTSWRPQIDPPSSTDNSTLPMNVSSLAQNLNLTDLPNLVQAVKSNLTQTSSNVSGAPMSKRSAMSCEEAAEASEHVRRYAELAMSVTKRLQDLTYAKRYQKINEQEENELILKLAWQLDRLAYLTGYEPDPKLYLHTRGTTRAPTTSPVPMTMVPSSPEQNQAYADCIKQDSPIPATERCQYVGAVPAAVQSFLDNMGSTTPSPEEITSSTDGLSIAPMSPDNESSLSSEILVTSDNKYPLSPTKSVTKRSADHEFHYPPDIKNKTPYPHLIANFIRKNLIKLKTVVKSVKSLKDSTYRALLDKEHHTPFTYGSIPYLTINKRSIDDSIDHSSNNINPLNNQNQINIGIPITNTVQTNNAIPVLKNTKEPVIEITESSYNHLPIPDVSVTNNKSFKKRSIDDHAMTSNQINNWAILRHKTDLDIPKPKVRSINKRSSDHPLSKLTNYYTKYKVWENSNPQNPYNDQITKTSETFDVKNHIRNKRSLFKKNAIHIHIPKPLEHVHLYTAGHRPHQTHPETHKAKILDHLKKIRDIAHKKIEIAHEINHKKLAKAHAIHQKHIVHKRSLHYEDLYLPRIPEDPQGDISYLVKNRKGTHYNPSLVQAAQVRAGLQQVFLTPNILVVQRYGSNYNPAVRNPFMAGVMKTMSDA